MTFITYSYGHSQCIVFLIFAQYFQTVDDIKLKIHEPCYSNAETKGNQNHKEESKHQASLVVQFVASNLAFLLSEPYHSSEPCTLPR